MLLPLNTVVIYYITTVNNVQQVYKQHWKSIATIESDQIIIKKKPYKKYEMYFVEHRAGVE